MQLHTGQYVTFAIPIPCSYAGGDWCDALTAPRKLMDNPHLSEMADGEDPRVKPEDDVEGPVEDVEGQARG